MGASTTSRLDTAPPQPGQSPSGQSPSGPSKPVPFQGSKIIPLEATRGLASFIVFFHHFTLAFTPAFREWIYRDPWLLWSLNWLFNGSAAVTFFFVLSGFVLTRKFFATGDSQIIYKGMLKRLPRLYLPAAASIFLALILILLGTEWHLEAARQTGSSWLANAGNANRPADFAPSFAGAALESLLVFLLPHNFTYNGNLWTMLIEFYGSIGCFIAALIMRRYLSGHLLISALLIIATCWIGLQIHIFLFYMASFLVGTFLAQLSVKGVEMPAKLRAPAAVLAVFLCSSPDPRLQLVASLLLVLSLSSMRKPPAFLDGALGRTLGRLSFPVYLVHTILITTLSSWLWLALTGAGWGIGLTTAVVFAVTALAILLISMPFAWLDEFWVRIVGRAANRSFLPKRSVLRSQ